MISTLEKHLFTKEEIEGYVNAQHLLVGAMAELVLDLLSEVEVLNSSSERQG